MNGTCDDIWNVKDSVDDYLQYHVGYPSFVIEWILNYYRERRPYSGDRIPFILDVGCGSGQLSILLSPHCERLLGIDIADEMIISAKKNNNRSNIEYKTASAYNLSKLCPAGSVDLMVVGTAGQLFDDDEFYSEVRKTLAPSGVFVQVGFWYPGFQHHLKYMDTFFMDWMRIRQHDDIIAQCKDKLSGHFQSLYCPLNGIHRKESRQVLRLPREYVTRVIKSFKSLLKDGEDAVQEFMEKLPPDDHFMTIAYYFALFAHL